MDHPSFGPAIIGRVLEAEGYRVAVLSQPNWRRPEAFSALGRPPAGGADLRQEPGLHGGPYGGEAPPR